MWQFIIGAFFGAFVAFMMFALALASEEKNDSRK